MDAAATNAIGDAKVFVNSVRGGVEGDVACTGVVHIKVDGIVGEGARHK